ncbi:MAG TPA: DNA-binding response regulator, partial [Chromatiaceae bacterium]|nr:DNA-binding response regulator [Chromatiaceae bacterium]
VDPKQFIRFNRQFVAGFESVDEIHPYFKGRLKVNLKPRQESDIVVSSERAAFVKEWLGK